MNINQVAGCRVDAFSVFLMILMVAMVSAPSLIWFGLTENVLTGPMGSLLRFTFALVLIPVTLGVLILAAYLARGGSE